MYSILNEQRLKRLFFLEILILFPEALLLDFQNFNFKCTNGTFTVKNFVLSVSDSESRLAARRAHLS